jgi:cell division septation protein DedD
MDRQVESGRTPYDFSSSTTIDGVDGRPVLSPANVAAGVALLALIGVVWFGAIFVQDLFGHIDRLGGEISMVHRRLEDQRLSAERTGDALVRGELAQTVATLEELAVSDNPDLAAAASSLLPEARALLAATVVSPTTATPTTEPTAAPTTEPTATPTTEPTATPTTEPTTEPTATPTAEPTATPTAESTATPTAESVPSP